MKCFDKISWWWRHCDCIWSHTTGSHVNAKAWTESNIKMVFYDTDEEKKSPRSYCGNSNCAGGSPSTCAPFALTQQVGAHLLQCLLRFFIHRNSSRSHWYFCYKRDLKPKKKNMICRQRAPSGAPLVLFVSNCQKKELLLHALRARARALEHDFEWVSNQVCIGYIPIGLNALFSFEGGQETFHWWGFIKNMLWVGSWKCSFIWMFISLFSPLFWQNGPKIFAY